MSSMRSMKTNLYILSCLLVTSFSLTASAMSGTSLQQGSLVNGDSDSAYAVMHDGGPRALSAGAYFGNQKRGMTDGNRDADWDINHIIGYLGLDLTPWLTILGGVGQSELSVDDDSRDAELDWMGGLQCRILDYLVLDPDGAYSVSMDGDFRALGSSSEGHSGDVRWLELFGAVTMSLTVNTDHGDFLDSVSIFAGPAFSTITASEDSFSNDWTEEQTMGFIGGLQINPSANTALRLEYQQFDSGTVGGSLSFHF